MMLVTYTPDTLAALLECEPETAAELLKNGELPGVKYGRGWIVPEDALRQRLNEIALQKAAERRGEREARGTATKAITTAKAKTGRARIPPALPSHP